MRTELECAGEAVPEMAYLPTGDGVEEEQRMKTGDEGRAWWVRAGNGDANHGKRSREPSPRETTPFCFSEAGSQLL